MIKQKLVFNPKIMRPLTIACILVLCINFTAFSQNKDFGDITVAMLEAKQSKIDSSAAAEVLNEKGKITFTITDRGWIYLIETTRRIKIFNKDGYDEANIEIPYYKGSTNRVSDKIKGIKANTYFLDEDGEVDDEKVRNKEIYDIEKNEYVDAKKFTFPKIQDGVIIEYSYSVESPNIRNLPNWSFQSNIPMVESTFEVIIPEEFLSYRSQTRGFNKVESSSVNGSGALSGITGRRFDLLHDTHIARNLKGVKGESHVNNFSNYITSISYELSSFRKGAVGDVEYLSVTWEDVVNSLKESESYSKELERTGYFQDDLNAYVEGVNDDFEKMNKILDFVKSKVEWNEKSRLFCSEDLDDIYEDGKGNSADINIMLTAMLRDKGLDAHPVVSSTISHGIPFFPTVTGFNYVISGVTIGENYYLLDATDPYSSPNLLPKRTMNWEGIEIFPTGSRPVKLIPNHQSKVNFNVMASINEDGTLAGQCRIYYFDQFGLNARNAFNDSSKEKVISTYEEEFDLKNVEDFKQSNLENLDQPLVQSFKFSETEGFVEKIGEKIYVSPLLFLKSEENPFKSKTRNFPIEFTYPKNFKYRLMIDLPKGYKIDYMPEKNIYTMTDGLLSFVYVVSENNGKIVVDITKDISTATLPSDIYPDLRDYYISMLDKENEKVVLVKS